MKYYVLHIYIYIYYLDTSELFINKSSLVWLRVGTPGCFHQSHSHRVAKHRYGCWDAVQHRWLNGLTHCHVTQDCTNVAVDLHGSTVSPCLVYHYG